METTAASTAGDIMTSPVVTVTAETPVDKVAGLLRRHRISAVPVVDNSGNVMGLVSEYDLLARSGATAGQLMSSEIATVSPETSVDTVRKLLVDRHFRRIPVVQGGQLVGIVSQGDIIALMATEWVCGACGEAVRGDEPPEKCPRCGSADQFSLQEQLPGT
ncbi:CBS domain-containing protein [Arthrobacter sp. USHLN218]|uniref:CBS domain-containing protein n=1 Tax=Arthrobacter sp. USHLN218 TaxID=3081232 RepID=UPI003016CF5C